MRIVMLRSTPVDPDPRVQKELASLFEGGHFVSVIGWNRTPGKDFGRSTVGVITLGREVAPITRINIPCSYGGGISNFFKFFRWNISLFMELFRKRREIDAIHACDFDTVIPAILIGRAFRKRVVYDIFDFFVDTFNVPTGLKSAFRWAELKAIGIVDAVILAGSDRISQIQGSIPKRYEVILNTPEDRGKSEYPFSEAGSLSIIYVGALVEHRFILEIIDIVAKKPSIKLKIAGWGVLEEKIVERISGHPNIKFLGRVDYSTTLLETSKADLNFAIYDPKVPNHRFSNPNKVYEAMMVGRPVIVACGMGIDQLVQTEACGFTVSYDSTESVESLLDKLLESPDQMRDLGRNGRLAYENVYSWAKMGSRLRALYESLEVPHQPSDAR